MRAAESHRRGHASRSSDAAAGDAWRIFATAVLVYLVFLAPALESPMTWSFLDGAVSLVQTGRWQVLHGEFYSWVDTVPHGHRRVIGTPPGMSLLLAPLYALWDALVGPVHTREEFVAFHALAAALFGGTASALGAVQAAWVAGWLGAGRRGQLWAAFLYAFGTHAFPFGTTLLKENVAALGAVTAFRLAVAPGGWWRRSLAGLLAGSTVAVAYQTVILPPLLLLLVARREAPRHAGAFLLGTVPPLVVLAAFHTWFFARPWELAYFRYPTPVPALILPTATFSLRMLLNPDSGLLAHSPFLVAGLAGLLSAWRRGQREESGVTLLFFLGLWLMAATWLEQWPEQFGSSPNGARYLLYAVPFLSGFAGLEFERWRRPARLAVALPSLAVCYVVTQAGYIPGKGEIAYAAKTLLSGTGMSVVFKELVPAWLALDTLHSVVSRPGVTGADLLRMLSTPAGLVLVRNQALMVALNLAVIAAIGWVAARMWRPSPGATTVAGTDPLDSTHG